MSAWLWVIPATIVAVVGVVFGALVGQAVLLLRRSHYEGAWEWDDVEDFT